MPARTRSEKRGRAARTAYLALATVDTVLTTRPRWRPARRVTKPLLMPALSVAFREGSAAPARRRGSALVRATTAAHALSWGGDVALLRRTERAFLTGVGSFFGAHVAYAAGFRSVGDPRLARQAPGPKVAAASWLALAPVMAGAAGRKDPHLRLPVAAYAGVLATMFATATTLDRVLPAAARRKVVAGASLFLLSDSLLGAQEFLREEHSPVLEAAVMATYTAGQLLMADGVAAATGETGR